MTLRKKLKLRNELREWATAIGIAILVFIGYGIAGYFEVIY